MKPAELNLDFTLQVISLYMLCILFFNYLQPKYGRYVLGQNKNFYNLYLIVMYL